MTIHQLQLVGLTAQEGDIDMAYYEDELLGMQGSTLDKSNKNLLAMQPFMLESLGLKRNPATGQIERVTDTSVQDPFLQRFKTDQKARLLGIYKSPQMEEGLLSWKNKFNPSNPEGMKEFDTNADILREGINRGGLESGANLLSQREGLLSNLKARDTGNYGSMGEADMKLLSGISTALQPYSVAREQLQNSQMQDDANRAGKKAGKTQAAATVVSAIIIIL